MPLYEYSCEACGHELDDVQQSIKDPPLKRCPECKKMKLQRVIGLTSFILQGGGWARENYGSTKQNKS